MIVALLLAAAPVAARPPMTAVDAELGPVFYALENVRESGTVTRFGGTCLICHDTFGLSGGGVGLERVEVRLRLGSEPTSLHE